MHIDWKKTAYVTMDILLGAYIVLAFTAFNKPDETAKICTQVNINIEDESTNGFINVQEIKKRLEDTKLYPLAKPMRYVDARKIEETLRRSPFVKSAECFKTQDGHVNVTLTQRLPVVRIKAVNGDDYYLDDKDCVMPNSHYTSDLIITTGYVSKWFATHYISALSRSIMANDWWRNLIVQINVLPDRSVELVPRVGDHIIYIGSLPQSKNRVERQRLVAQFLKTKMSRLEKFYRYGLSQAGWNKYSYIDLEFDNQIICTRRHDLPETDKEYERPL